ncbi:hypothetical protein ACGFI9_29210 [Micromonospora sp. NPDC048930]|uniref:hypothetical protein n=1 Tax=Micromonospora sp. NPDC048930 TaxID=3364261 RepID=UPI003722BBAD
MSGDTEDPAHGWHYASPRTLAGALQRGLGRGAYQALVDPTAPALVIDCLRRDHRWFWQVDEREVYLARLVRDLRLPARPIVARLSAAPSEESDDDNEFANTLAVLEVLGRAGYDGVVEEIRSYLRDGERWLDVVQTVARSWPVEWWDDLRKAISGRLDTANPDRLLWRSPPWTTWADRDARIGAAVDAARRPLGPPRPFAGTASTALLDLLGDPGRAADWRPALRELRRRPPEPALLARVDGLLAAEVGHPLADAVVQLGALAVPAARSWARTPRHPLFWTGLRLLAAHGGPADGPALLAGLDWLDSRPDDLCGYDVLVTGLARLGGPDGAAVLPWLRRLWFSPHSYERADYLRARTALDPAGAARALFEGLWDCESEVRLLATRQVALDDPARDRLHQLRDDTMEVAEVRAAAAERLD